MPNRREALAALFSAPVIAKAGTTHAPSKHIIVLVAVEWVDYKQTEHILEWFHEKGYEGIAIPVYGSHHAPITLLSLDESIPTEIADFKEWLKAPEHA